MKKDIRQIADKAIAEFDSSKAFYTQIQKERDEALKYYMQLPMGNEVDGFSKYVSSDVRDVVNWGLAQLMEMFTGSAPVKFNPVNAADVDQSDLETKYTHHVIFEENKGFEMFSTWFLDALIQKNGVVKAYWEDKIDEKPENYEEIGHFEFVKLIEDKEYQVEKVKIQSDVFAGEFSLAEYEQALAQALLMNPQLAEALAMSAKFNVKGVRVRDVSQVKIENIAPERFYVSRNQLGIDIDEADYIAEQCYVSRNALISQGYDYEQVMALPVANLISGSSSSVTRYTKESANQISGAVTSAGELVEVIIHHIREATDNNPKLYRIETCGDEIIDHEEVDRHPYHVITPKINPYRFYGDSLADEVIDIQYSKSNLWRAAFDNVKYSVVPRTISKGDVNFEDLMDYVPGSNVRLGPDGELSTFNVPFIANDAIVIGDLLEKQRAERTGFSRETTGLDASALAQTTNFVGSAILNLSNLRTKMIASTFANTGVKSLYLHVREMMIRNEDRTKLFEFNGKYVDINPRSWFKSRSTTVKTGLGHAGRLEAATAMANILQLQEKLVTAQDGIMGPFVGPDQIYRAIARNLELAGVPDVETFFMNPEGWQPPPPEPTPQDKQTMAYVQVEQYKADKNFQSDMHKTETDASVKIYDINQKVLLENQKMTKEYQAELKENNLRVADALQKKLIDGASLDLQDKKIEADLTKHRIDAKLKVSAEMADLDDDLNPGKSRIVGALSDMGSKMEKALSKLEEGQKLTAKEQAALNKELVQSLTRKKRVIRDADGNLVGVE